MDKSSLFKNFNPLFYSIIFLFIFLKTASSQVIPSEFFQYKLSRLLYDSGENWDKHSLFNDIRYEKVEKEKKYRIKNSLIKSKISLYTLNKKNSITAYSYIFFENNFFSYFNLNINDEVSSFRLYKNIEKKIMNSSTKTIKIDFSGFGFENNWVNVQINRGSERWGAGENIELALSNSSDSYDYFELGSDYGNIRVKSIYGFLEKSNDNINRYITGRGIEWSNKKSFIIGFSETVIYSGYNRSFDIGYLNPVSSHLETELNNRLNIKGNENSNAVWQLHSDLLLKEKIRISFNYLFDEFVLDPDIEIGKDHGRAFSLRFSYSVKNQNKNMLTFYFKNIFVGSPTFRHGNGTNNFVQKNRPLGWEKGSDSQEISFGLNYSNKKTIFWFFNSGSIWSGDENIKERAYDPYKNYLKDSFPSGYIIKKRFLDSNFEWWIKKNFRLSFFLNLDNINTSKVLIGFNIDIPNEFSL